MGKVIPFPVFEDVTPKTVFAKLAEDSDLVDAIILGYAENGDLFYASSFKTPAEANMCLDKIKDHIVGLYK